MGGRTVRAPDGREWKVGRDWLPRRVRLRREREPGGSLDLVELVDLDAGPVAAVLAVIVLVVFLFAVVWPLVALALEVVILIFLFLAALAGRLLLGRPWRVLARADKPYPERRAWQVAGWRASRDVIDDVARAIETGQEPRPRGAVLARGD